MLEQKCMMPEVGVLESLIGTDSKKIPTFRLEVW